MEKRKSASKKKDLWAEIAAEQEQGKRRAFGECALNAHHVQSTPLTTRRTAYLWAARVPARQHSLAASSQVVRARSHVQWLSRRELSNTPPALHARAGKPGKARPTQALEYTFGRKNVGVKLTKNVGHIWELGGGSKLATLLEVGAEAAKRPRGCGVRHRAILTGCAAAQVPLTEKTISTSTVFIVVDLSRYVCKCLRRARFAGAECKWGAGQAAWCPPWCAGYV